MCICFYSIHEYCNSLIRQILLKWRTIIFTNYEQRQPTHSHRTPYRFAKPSPRTVSKLKPNRSVIERAKSETGFGFVCQPNAPLVFNVATAHRTFSRNGPFNLWRVYVRFDSVYGVRTSRLQISPALSFF